MNKSNHISDSDWILATKQGDIRAFNELFDSYAKRLYRFSVSYLKSAADAEEIVQKVFIKIWNNRQELSIEKSFDAMHEFAG